MTGLFFGMSGVRKRADENGDIDLILTTPGAIEAIIAVCIILLVGFAAYLALA